MNTTNFVETTVEEATVAEHADNTTTPPEPAFLPQEPLPLSERYSHPVAGYHNAAIMIQHQLVSALGTLSEKLGPDWMQTERFWSLHLATQIATGLEKDGCLFPDLLYSESGYNYPVATRSLRREDIAEYGFDASGLTHEDMARFASVLRWGQSIRDVAQSRFGLKPLITRDQIAECGVDPSGMTDEELLRFSAAVYEEMAGFDPDTFPQDFKAVICAVAAGETTLLCERIRGGNRMVVAPVRPWA
jgi:hypothetical protein